MFFLHLIWTESDLLECIDLANYIHSSGETIDLIVCSPLYQSVEVARRMIPRLSYGDKNPIYLFPFIYDKNDMEIEWWKEKRYTENKSISANPIKTLSYPSETEKNATFLSYAIPFIKQLLWVKKNMYRRISASYSPVFSYDSIPFSPPTFSLAPDQVEEKIEFTVLMLSHPHYLEKRFNTYQSGELIRQSYTYEHFLDDIPKSITCQHHWYYRFIKLKKEDEKKKKEKIAVKIKPFLIRPII